MSVLNSYFDIQKQEVMNYYDEIDNRILEEVAYIIKQQESKGCRVHTTGIGKPGHLASYVASLFSSIGTPTYFLDGTEAIHGSSGQVKEGDVVIAMSNSGQTEELKKTLMTLRNNGAILVTVTGNADSWMAENSDYHIFAGVTEEGDNLNKPPRSSILVETIAMQALSVILQDLNNLTPEVYVKWHPGGSLGKSILDKKK
ncbi:SIS domain-containing protein [Erysipelothrix inopinata]|uniref:SIS domain-containing protein n=1 Tax=Erysipelothrix inopinata TaxID=225084 RepID=A0A7G9RZQ9_9FIRM|nr:SIS domain-containing protein [Erysipelothrix inopinata]QNN61084.1 SIS domain-containing protein [Erysipelothrix inopinata]